MQLSGIGFRLQVWLSLDNPGQCLVVGEKQYLMRVNNQLIIRVKNIVNAAKNKTKIRKQTEMAEM